MICVYWRRRLKGKATKPSLLISGAWVERRFILPSWWPTPCLPAV